MSLSRQQRPNDLEYENSITKFGQRLLSRHLRRVMQKPGKYAGARFFRYS